jgi:hypothetical protein
VLAFSAHQWKIVVHPEGIPATLDKLEDPPWGDLRSLATRKVKARGIDYLLVDDQNWNAADMWKDPPRWGMDFVTERAGNRLYKIR